ncbi:MAG: T9SS type A sorting domain-containing protein [Flammeovirgaceae bacterium]
MASNIHAAGYDIAILNFNDASDQIQRNARVLKDFIIAINNGKSNADQHVVIGYSMGGLVTRYALVEMENQSIAHQTRLYVSYDTPHKGAHVPASVQSLALTFDSPTFRTAFPDLAVLLDRFKFPAAQQMLKYRVTSPNVSQTLPVSSSHTAFFNELNNLNTNGGFPRNCQSVALSLGNWGGIPQRANFDSDGDGRNDFQYSGFPAVFINFHQSSFSGSQSIWQLNGCQAVGAFAFQSFLSTSPALNYPYFSARSGYLGLGNSDFATFFYTNSTNTALLPFGAFSTYVNYNNAEPIDFAPGSLSNTYQQVVNTLNSQINCSFAYYNNSTFVPTVSALAFNTTDLFYKIGDDVNRLSSTPFADVFAFCDDNRSHTNSITTNFSLVQWVMNKINGQSTIPCYCGASASINGSSLLCSNPTPYTIQNLPPNTTVSWSSSNPSGISFNPITGSSTTAIRTNNFNGQATITATITGGCGNVNVPFNVWVGTPPANNSTLIWTGIRGVNPVTLNTGSINYYQVDNVANATSYTWSLPRGFTAYGSSTTTSGPQISIITSNQAGTYSLLCRANNACGSSWTNSLTINVVGGGGGGGIQMRAAFPNPANDSFTVKVKEADSKEVAEIALFNKSMERVYFTKTEEKEVTVSTTNLLPGLYYLNVVIGKEVTQKQVVVNH